MDNNYNLNWYNYKSFEPKDMSNYGIGYQYKPADYMNTNFSPSHLPLTKTPEYGIGFNPNSYAPYAENNRNSDKSWGNKVWNNTKSFLPQSYGEAGALLSGVGSIWGAIAGAKAAKDANETAKEVLEEQRKQNQKRQEEADALSKSINDVWNRD